MSDVPIKKRGAIKLFTDDLFTHKHVCSGTPYLMSIYINGYTVCGLRKYYSTTCKSVHE